MYQLPDVLALAHRQLSMPDRMRLAAQLIRATPGEFYPVLLAELGDDELEALAEQFGTFNDLDATWTHTVPS